MNIENYINHQIPNDPEIKNTLINASKSESKDYTFRAYGSFLERFKQTSIQYQLPIEIHQTSPWMVLKTEFSKYFILLIPLMTIIFQHGLSFYMKDFYLKEEVFLLASINICLFIWCYIYDLQFYYKKGVNEIIIHSNEWKKILNKKGIQ